MTATNDQLIGEIAFLKSRVEALEQSVYSAPGDYIEGWTEAARFLGVGGHTVRRRLEAGVLPAPCGMVTVARKDGQTHDRPRWRRNDLVAYAENLRG